METLGVLLCPKASPTLASFQQKLEPRKLLGKTHFMTRPLFLFPCFHKDALKKSAYTLSKTFPSKDLGSSFRWNDGSLRDRLRKNSFIGFSLKLFKKDEGTKCG